MIKINSNRKCKTKINRGNKNKQSKDKLVQMEKFASLTNSAGRRQMFKEHENKDSCIGHVIATN